mmetsp:Transcript_164069/g.526141  ORF Transcript_164069/g.526141 Transcript_164069/m.526141 type:complete len:441 (-) Transcript_164069:1173-2495(-)
MKISLLRTRRRIVSYRLSMRLERSCARKFARLLSKSRHMDMCFSSGLKDFDSRPGVCLIKAFRGRRCRLQNCPRRDFSTNETSSTSSKTFAPAATGVPDAICASSWSFAFFLSSLSCLSCSASFAPSCSTKNASIRGKSRLSNGFGGAACTLDAKCALVSSDNPEAASVRIADGATPNDNKRCAGVAITSVSAKRSNVRSRAPQRVSIFAASRNSSILSSFSGIFLSASLKTSASARTTRRNLVSRVDGSAVIISHFASDDSMSVTRDTNTRISSDRTMSRCAWEAASATRISVVIWNVSPSEVEPCPLPAWHKKWQSASTLFWDKIVCMSCVILDQRFRDCSSAEGGLLPTSPLGLPPPLPVLAAPPALAPAPALTTAAGASAGMAGSAPPPAAAAAAAASAFAAASFASLRCTSNAWRMDSSHVACCDDDRNSFVVRS